MPTFKHAFTSLALLAAPCACAPAVVLAPQPVVLTDAGQTIRVTHSDPGLKSGCQELMPIEAKHGDGCGDFGLPGNVEEAYNLIRNRAAAAGANVAHVYLEIPPHATPACYVDTYEVHAMALKCDGVAPAVAMARPAPTPVAQHPQSAAASPAPAHAQAAATGPATAPAPAPAHAQAANSSPAAAPAAHAAEPTAAAKATPAPQLQRFTTLLVLPAAAQGSLPPDLASKVNEQLADNLARVGKLATVSEAKLGPAKTKQVSECKNVNCVTHFASSAGADLVARVSVHAAGDNYAIRLSILSASQGAEIGRVARMTPKTGDMHSALDELVAEMAAKINGAAQEY